MMPRTWMAGVTAAMLVSGCMELSPGTTSGSNHACMADNMKFADAWSCVRARLVAKQGTDGHPDGLIEEGDILASDVKANKVSEAEARKRLDVGIAHDGS